MNLSSMYSSTWIEVISPETNVIIAVLLVHTVTSRLHTKRLVCMAGVALAVLSYRCLISIVLCRAQAMMALTESGVVPPFQNETQMHWMPFALKRFLLFLL